MWTRDSREGKLERENLRFAVNVHVKHLSGLEAHTTSRDRWGCRAPRTRRRRTQGSTEASESESPPPPASTGEEVPGEVLRRAGAALRQHGQGGRLQSADGTRARHARSPIFPSQSFPSRALLLLQLRLWPLPQRQQHWSGQALDIRFALSGCQELARMPGGSGSAPPATWGCGTPTRRSL